MKKIILVRFLIGDTDFSQGASDYRPKFNWGWFWFFGWLRFRVDSR